VIGFQSLHVNEAMGWLRRLGTVVVTSLHVIDQDGFGAPTGHPYLHLPYEHVYDIVTAPSRALLRFCAGAGVPAAKLLLLRNAPSFIADGEAIGRRLEQLAAEERPLPHGARRPLRVLYLGRLDRQKGGERLLGTIRATRAAGPRMVWRVIGGAVVPDGRADWAATALADFGIRPEPAVYDRAALAERLLWADVLLLPSRWEGSPLIVLEAQALGAVPVATDVGAVDEVLEDGVTGVLVRGDSDTALSLAMADALRLLARHPALRARLSRSAMATVRDLTWERTVAPLLDDVERLVAARQG
jgi:glycosyltransferase involved in cell wall biosynthesis